MKNKDKTHGNYGKITLLSLIIMLTMIFFASCSGSAEEEEPPAPPTNPLTGASIEEGFDENAANQRIAAFVVENSKEARPQWGIDDENYSPDVILQGEVEAGVTRMLWLYADYNKLPDIIGPMRSARPPYIRFSELFDSIFIHWGRSTSKDDYVGANTVFKEDNVDHIDQLYFSDAAGMYDRDQSRSVAMEHTGIVHGDKVPEAVKEAGFRTEPNEYTQLHFSETAGPLSEDRADEIKVDYSDKTSYESTVWTYNTDDKLYHTEGFGTDVARDNLIILYDSTSYIDKTDYQGQTGNTVTYCDYSLGGGEGKLMSRGTVIDIEWYVEGGKLVLVDTAATEAARAEAEAAEGADESAESDEEAPEPVVYASLNKGKTWIGWISSNNGGNVDITADPNNAEAESETSDTDAGDSGDGAAAE